MHIARVASLSVSLAYFHDEYPVRASLVRETKRARARIRPAIRSVTEGEARAGTSHSVYAHLDKHGFSRISRFSITERSVSQSTEERGKQEGGSGKQHTALYDVRGEYRRTPRSHGSRVLESRDCGGSRCARSVHFVLYEVKLRGVDQASACMIAWILCASRCCQPSSSLPLSFSIYLSSNLSIYLSVSLSLSFSQSSATC